jgi:phosphoglycerate dehydrogenase-like enzyme
VRRLLLGLFTEAEAWRIPDDAVAALRGRFPDVEVTHAATREEFDGALPDAEIVFSWLHGRDMLDRARRLRWFHAPSAGVGAFLTPGVLARGPIVTNSRGVHAVPIAEHVMGFLVALARGFRAALAEQMAGGMRDDRWESAAGGVPRELAGLTLGLFGYGAIGREVARRAASFGMRIIALKRHPERAETWDAEWLAALGLPAEDPTVAAVFGPGDLARFLSEADVVVVAAPLTPETAGVFDANAFAGMKPGAWFVNVGRGKIHREDALIAALRSGRLGGAGLDVFEAEPLPPESELYSLDNVILTPHVSGLSSAYWGRAMRLFEANLTRDGAGRPLLNRVDLVRGY